MAYRDQPLSVSAGGTGAGTFTAYSVLTAGTTSTGALQNVSGVGTTGQVLTSTGASSVPTWQAASNFVVIQSQTASGSSGLTFTSGITSAYNNFFLLFSDVTLSGSIQLVVQLSVSAGVYITTGYTSGQNIVKYNSSTLANTNFTNGLLLIDSNSTSTISGFTYLQNLTSGLNIPTAVGNVSLYDTAASGAFQVFTCGSYNTTSTVIAFKILPSSGTFSGTFTLFGYLE